jgi:hypothetical protein
LEAIVAVMGIVSTVVVPNLKCEWLLQFLPHPLCGEGIDVVAGSVVSTLQARKGMLQDMHEAAGRCKMMFHVPTRGLIGYKRIFTAITKGEGLINRAFLVCASLLGCCRQA